MTRFIMALGAVIALGILIVFASGEITGTPVNSATDLSELQGKIDGFQVKEMRVFYIPITTETNSSITADILEQNARYTLIISDPSLSRRVTDFLQAFQHSTFTLIPDAGRPRDDLRFGIVITGKDNSVLMTFYCNKWCSQGLYNSKRVAISGDAKLLFQQYVQEFK